MLSQAFTIASRVIKQITRDHRTMALIVAAPLMIITLIGLSIPEAKILDFIAPALLVTLAFFFSFLLTGISFLRERSQGTMERLMASPASRLDIVVGYLFGFFVFALTQCLIILLFAVYVLKVNYGGNLWEVLIFETIVVTGAVNLGIFVSTFARNEFQVIQFIPLIITPQIFLCGVLWPVEQMPEYLQWLSVVLPLTYAVDGLRDIMLAGKTLLDVGLELTILIGFTIIMSVLAAITLRRSSG